ncbi:MAG: type VI secretion system baseplate subunit TssG [Massilia sp.]|nr:type VI secretion system baseplate subunit TssG [Massilia sp.]
MQTKERQPESGVIDHLFDAPEKYQFKQALRMVLVWLRSKGVSYEDAFKHVLRFQNSVSFGFPASEIEALRADFGADFGAELAQHGPCASTPPEAATKVFMTPAFIGLLGGSGTLPLHYSERIATQQLHEKDDSARAFLDILSNRMVGLFFLACGKYRLESKVDTHGVDPLRAMLMQLSGFHVDDAGEHAGGENDVLAYFSAALRTRPTSSFAIAGALSAHFGVPIEIEQFVGCWDELDKNQRTILGKTRPTLGNGATLGKRLWRHDLRMCLHVGPLNKQELDRFLPNGEAAAAMATMLKHFGVAHLQLEMRLIFKPEAIKPVVLRTTTSTAKRLGWDSFLTCEDGKSTRGDVRYMLKMRTSRPPLSTPLPRVS